MRLDVHLALECRLYRRNKYLYETENPIWNKIQMFEIDARASSIECGTWSHICYLIYFMNSFRYALINGRSSSSQQNDSNEIDVILFQVKQFMSFSYKRAIW